MAKTLWFRAGDKAVYTGSTECPSVIDRNGETRKLDPFIEHGEVIRIAYAFKETPLGCEKNLKWYSVKTVFGDYYVSEQHLEKMPNEYQFNYQNSLIDK